MRVLLEQQLADLAPLHSCPVQISSSVFKSPGAAQDGGTPKKKVPQADDFFSISSRRAWVTHWKFDHLTTTILLPAPPLFPPQTSALTSLRKPQRAHPLRRPQVPSSSRATHSLCAVRYRPTKVTMRCPVLTRAMPLSGDKGGGQAAQKAAGGRIVPCCATPLLCDVRY
eukprot:2458108-Rhodomonas_salina.4